MSAQYVLNGVFSTPDISNNSFVDVSINEGVGAISNWSFHFGDTNNGSALIVDGNGGGSLNYNSYLYTTNLYYLPRLISFQNTLLTSLTGIKF